MEPIVTKALSTGYNGNKITENVNISIIAGKITTIVGGSGSGKTTLFKTIIGLIPPIIGDVFLLGTALNKVSEKEKTLVLSRIGMLFQYGALLNSLTVYENTAFPLREHFNIPEKLIDVLVRTSLSRLGLLEAAYKYPSDLSGGMKKRAALARALIHEPDILLCDEPSAGLDPITASELDKLILELNRIYKLTTVVVTHELNSIKTISDYIIMLGEGRVYFAGTANEFYNSEDTKIKQFLNPLG